MITLTKMNPAEFAKYSHFSFELFVSETAKSSGLDAQSIREKVGGAPKEIRENDLWLVIKNQDSDVGYLWVEVKKDGSALGWDIFLNKDQRSKGIGRQVMLEMGAVLSKHNVNRVEICVLEENKVARALYTSLGFKQVHFNEAHKRYTLEYSLLP